MLHFLFILLSFCHNSKNVIYKDFPHFLALLPSYWKNKSAQQRRHPPTYPAESRHSSRLVRKSDQYWRNWFDNKKNWKQKLTSFTDRLQRMMSVKMKQRKTEPNDRITMTATNQKIMNMISFGSRHKGRFANQKRTSDQIPQFCLDSRR